MREWLKEMRNNRHLTQEEVAKLSGISRTHYTQIETGNKTPSVEVAKRIARTLKFDWVVFFDNKCSLKEQKQLV